MVAKTFRELGEETGLVKGRIEMLQGILSERFGSLDSGVQAKLNAMSKTELDELAKKVLRGEPLPEIGLPVSP